MKNTRCRSDLKNSTFSIMPFLFCVLFCMVGYSSAGSIQSGLTTGPDGELILNKFPLGPFVRDEGADRIGARETSDFLCPVRGETIKWEDKDVLCAAAVVKDGKVYMFYRAEDRSRVPRWGTSRIGLAISEDGRHFNRHPEPVLYPDNDFMKEYEWPGGCQDPRVMETEDGTYVMTYTSWDGNVARLSIATSKDLYKWTKHGLAIGDYKNGRYRDLWTKAGSIVCRMEGSRFVAHKINGKYWMYFGEGKMYVATSDDLIKWDVIERNNAVLKGNIERKNDNNMLLLVCPNRKGFFDERIAEPGPPALLTDKGILLIYNGGANRPDLGLKGLAWSIGQVLFDAQDPTKIVGRTDKDIFHPECSYEIGSRKRGGNNNVTFVESLIWFNNEWRWYYGCADSVVASAVYKPLEK